MLSAIIARVRKSWPRILVVPSEALDGGDSAGVPAIEHERFAADLAAKGLAFDLVRGPGYVPRILRYLLVALIEFA